MRISGISGGFPPSSKNDPFSNAKKALVKAGEKYKKNPESEKKIRADLIKTFSTFQARFDWDNNLTKALRTLENENLNFKAALNKAAEELQINSWQSL